MEAPPTQQLSGGGGVWRPNPSDCGVFMMFQAVVPGNRNNARLQNLIPDTPYNITVEAVYAEGPGGRLNGNGRTREQTHTHTHTSHNMFIGLVWSHSSFGVLLWERKKEKKKETWEVFMK